MEQPPPSPIENPPATEWTLWRQDIHGNLYRLPATFADETTAIAAQEAYAAKGHHQTYFVKALSAGDSTEFIAARSERSTAADG